MVIFISLSTITDNVQKINAALIINGVHIIKHLLKSLLRIQKEWVL